MPKAATTANPAPDQDTVLGQILATLQGIQETQRTQGEAITSLQNPEPEGEDDFYSLAELNDMDDASLAALNLTRAMVNDAVTSATTGAAATTEGADNPANARGGTSAAPAMAGAGAGAGAGGGGVAFQALMREFNALNGQVQLMIQTRRQEKIAAEEAEMLNAFEVLQSKYAEIEAEVVELRAKNQAYELSAKTHGNRPVKQGNGDIIMFSAREGVPANTFEAVVQTKFVELKAQIGSALVPTELSAKSQAIDFGRINHPALYSDYRGRGGKLALK